MRALKTSLIFLLFFGGQALAAEEERRPWSSIAHLAYAIEDRSQDEFERDAGSAILMDILYRLDPETRVGMRTTANGGSQQGTDYYRLGAGPMVSFDLDAVWSADLAFGLFRESGVADGESSYTSWGQSIQVGWERKVRFGKTLALGWGGFVGRHWGRVKQKKAAAKSPMAAANWNIGNTMGIHLALHLPL